MPEHCKNPTVKYANELLFLFFNRFSFNFYATWTLILSNCICLLNSRARWTSSRCFAFWALNSQFYPKSPTCERDSSRRNGHTRACLIHTKGTCFKHSLLFRSLGNAFGILSKAKPNREYHYIEIHWQTFDALIIRYLENWYEALNDPEWLIFISVVGWLPTHPLSDRKCMETSFGIIAYSHLGYLIGYDDMKVIKQALF